NFCYTTPFVIKQEIEAAGTVDRAKFRDALRALQTKETTSGVPIAFDKNGARQEYIYYMQITGMNVAKKEYSAKQVFYMEWSPVIIPFYALVKWRTRASIKAMVDPNLLIGLSMLTTGLVLGAI